MSIEVSHDTLWKGIIEDFFSLLVLECSDTNNGGKIVLKTSKNKSKNKIKQ